MSHHSMEPRGARDFSSPQVRVRGANDFRQYTNQRLRLPNERRPLGPRIKRAIGALLTLAIVGAIGVAVYFGVSLLLEADDSPAVQSQQTVEAVQAVQAASGNGGAAAAPAGEAQSEQPSSAAQPSGDAAADPPPETEQAATTESDAQIESTDTPQQTAQTEQSSVPISAIEPTVAEQQVTSAQVDGAETVAERVTAEAVPSGIPRALADGADYDPSDPATVFTSRWPVGTTLRLTRLPGATVLSDEEQDQVVGLAAMVVVRGSESSNTDLQLSPAAFEQIGFYGRERIIAVHVEVTAPPP